MSQWPRRRRLELHSALSNARAEVVQQIMGFLTLDEAQLAALEKRRGGGEVGLVKLRYDQNLLKSTVSRIGLALTSAGEHIWIDFAGPLLPPPLNVVHRKQQ